MNTVILQGPLMPGLSRARARVLKGPGRHTTCITSKNNVTRVGALF